MAESLDDTQGLIVAINDVGRVALRRGGRSRAVSSHERAVALAQQRGEPDLLIASLTDLATAEHQSGALQEAEHRYEQALDLAQQRGDRSAEATIRNNLGLIRQAKGDVEQAAQLFRQAMALNQALGNLNPRPATMSTSACWPKHGMSMTRPNGNMSEPWVRTKRRNSGWRLRRISCGWGRLRIDGGSRSRPDVFRSGLTKATWHKMHLPRPGRR